MRYTFVQAFTPLEDMLTEEQRIEIAQNRAAKELARILLKDAVTEVCPDRTIRITFDNV
jgi:hypothetical protein